MRISKEPEIRKQEIIDVAMKVFNQKGYEAATMKDIAEAAGVVPGLCYHYFRNKQELYQAAVSQYARECSRSFIGVFSRTDLTLWQCLDLLEEISVKQDREYEYKDFFDKEGNELFHKQLELYMSKEIFPYVQKYLDCLAERKEIVCENTYLFARFFWEGQMAVISEPDIPIEERIRFIRDMMKRLVR